jgi:Flp pilus assembly protein TadD
MQNEECRTRHILFLILHPSSFIILEKVPFFLTAAFFSGVTFVVQKHGGAVVASLPFSDRLANAIVSYCRYLGKLFWPTDLAVFYPGVEHWPIAAVGAAALLLLAISLVAIALWRAHPYVLVGWLWYLGTLVPVIGLVQVGMQSMADRYSYIPSIGILLALVWAAHAVAAVILPSATRWRYYALGAGSVLTAAALACAVLTWRQIACWKDTERLFRHALRVTKDNYGAHHALGMALDRQGRLAEAISEYRATIRARSNYALAYNNLAVDLNQQGHRDEARKELETAMKIEPTYADPYNNMGMILEEEGRYDEALRLFQHAVKLNPNLPNPNYNLGNSLGRKGLYEEAAKAFQRVIALRPNDAEAHNNLGFMLERQGRLAEATQEYLRAAQLKPDYPRAHYNLGLALARQDHLPEAAAEFREALRLKPDYPAARTNLALVLSLMQSAQTKPDGSRNR